MVYIYCFALGMLSFILISNIVFSVSERMNNGKKVFVNRRAAGYIVSCRFNGSKKWFYIDEHMDRSKDHYFTREEAVEACQNAFSKDRPKQSIYMRAS